MSSGAAVVTDAAATPVPGLETHDDVISADEAPTAAAAPSPDPAAGKRIGPYRILQMLGEGGMGTVYLAPEPGAPDFVRVGSKVAEGQTMLIVEAMKTMNYIPAHRSGTVMSILVANEQPVEFNEPLLVIE